MLDRQWPASSAGENSGSASARRSASQERSAVIMLEAQPAALTSFSGNPRMIAASAEAGEVPGVPAPIKQMSNAHSRRFGRLG